MNDKELCRAWRDTSFFYHYVDSAGGHWWNNRDEGTVDLDHAARRDGYEIRWPDGPGLAELVEIVDVWAQARAALDCYARVNPDGGLSSRLKMAAALRALLDAHDRGELR